MAHCSVDLETQRDQAQAEIDKLSKLFTSTTAEISLKHRYNLRGVSIGPDHTEQFVLVDPPAYSDAQAHEDEATNIEVPSKWWRIQFLPNNKPQKETTDIEDVLHAACSSSRDVMLVYANDEACERRSLQLCGALKTFINKDNELFSQEVAEHIQNAEQIQDDLPPAYENLSPNDGRWVDQNPHVVPGGGFTPDPGVDMVSDAEYRANTDLSFASQPYANVNSSSSLSELDEDVRMGGTSADRIEDVTDVGDGRRGPLKGG